MNSEHMSSCQHSNTVGIRDLECIHLYSQQRQCTYKFVGPLPYTCRHQKALEAQTQKTGAGSITAGVANMEKRSQSIKAGMFPTMLLVALFLVTCNVAGAHFANTLQLLTFLNVWKSEYKYNHRRYFWACLYALSEVLLVRQIERINKSPFFSLLMDSSTDISNENHVLMYIMYLDMSTYKPVVEYLCTVKVASKTAEAIYQAAVRVLSTLGISIKKLVCLCADGGSEYAGRVNGLGAKLKSRDVPYLLVNQCAAHKVNLVMTDQGKSTIPDADIDADLRDPVSDLQSASSLYRLSFVDKFLRDVHGMFANSSKRKALWCLFAIKKGLTKLAFPIFNLTRWFSRYACVVTLVQNLAVLIMFMQRFVALVTGAQDLLDRFADPNSVALLFVMADVMTIMQEFSTSVQADSLMSHHVRQHVDVARQKLSSCVQVKDDRFLYDCKLMPQYHSFRISTQIRNGRTEWRSKYGVIQFQKNTKLDHTACLSFVFDLCVSMKRSIAARFPDQSVLRSFRIFDPATFHGVSIEEAQHEDFLKGEFRVLLNQFARKDLSMKIIEIPQETMFLDPDTGDVCTITGFQHLLEEFQKYKVLMHGFVQERPTANMSSAWLHLSSVHGSVIPHILPFVHVAFVVAVQSAVVERGFSQHSIIKDSLSNSLRLVTIDSLMRLRMLCPEDFAKIDLSLIDDATEILLSTGLRSERKPQKVAALFQAVCDVSVPHDFIEAFEDDDPSSVLCVLNPSALEYAEWDDDDGDDGDEDLEGDGDDGTGMVVDDDSSRSAQAGAMPCGVDRRLADDLAKELGY